MDCCACRGVCYHVGNHSFCSAHGGVFTIPWTSPPFTILWTSPPQPNTAAYFTPTQCEHCWCQREGMDHEVCCNCGLRRLRKNDNVQRKDPRK